MFRVSLRGPIKIKSAGDQFQLLGGLFVRCNRRRSVSFDMQSSVVVRKPLMLVSKGRVVLAEDQRSSPFGSGGRRATCAKPNRTKDLRREAKVAVLSFGAYFFPRYAACSSLLHRVAFCGRFQPHRPMTRRSASGAAAGC
jgi:hypothetical protein